MGKSKLHSKFKINSYSNNHPVTPLELMINKAPEIKNYGNVNTELKEAPLDNFNFTFYNDQNNNKNKFNVQTSRLGNVYNNFQLHTDRIIDQRVPTL